MMEFLETVYDLRPILFPIALTITLVGLVLLKIGLDKRKREN